MTAPLDFIKSILTLIDETNEKAANERVDLIKTTIENYLDGYPENRGESENDLTVQEVVEFCKSYGYGLDPRCEKCPFFNYNNPEGTDGDWCPSGCDFQEVPPELWKAKEMQQKIKEARR